MANEHQLSYTAEEIDERLGMIDECVPVVIDLDTYGETPINQIVGQLFTQGGGVVEDVDIGSLMQDIDTDRSLCVKLTMSPNELRMYGVSVIKYSGVCVQLCMTGMLLYHGTQYMAHTVISAPPDSLSQGTITVAVEEPGALQEAATDMEAILNGEY